MKSLCILSSVALFSMAVPASAAVIIFPTDQGRIVNSTLARAGSLSEGRTIRAGTTASNVVFTGFMIYNSASFTDPLDTATLTFDIHSRTGSPVDLLVYGVSSADATGGFNTGINLTTEYATLVNPTSPTLIQTLVAPANGVYNVDVTAFLAAERTAGHTIVGFALRESSTTLNSVSDTFEIWDSNDGAAGTVPSLTLTTPEPASLALLGIGSLAMFSRKRSASRR